MTPIRTCHDANRERFERLSRYDLTPHLRFGR
jgi:hypothetical protein